MHWLKRPAGARWGPIRNMNHQLEMLPNTVTEQEGPRPLQRSLQRLRGRRNCLRDNNLCNTPNVRSLLWREWESGLKEPEPMWPQTEEKIQVSAQQWCKTRQTTPESLGESLSVVENPWTLWIEVFRDLNVTVKYKRCFKYIWIRFLGDLGSELHNWPTIFPGGFIQPNNAEDPGNVIAQNSSFFPSKTLLSSFHWDERGSASNTASRF